ncbi:MAG: DNA translocase FtsK [Proteobacteria bacterium]|nr:DNA translocase FtsK [Pseudomonadota bacterium]
MNPPRASSPSTKKAADKAPDRGRRPWLSRRGGEVLGLLLWLLAILAGLALFSHHANDPGVDNWRRLLSFSGVHNLVGPLGALVSQGLLRLLGLASFWLLLILALEGFFLLLGRKSGAWWRLAGGGGLIVLSAAMIHLVRPQAPLFGYQPGPDFLATGGVVGRAAAEALSQYMSPLGAALVLGAGLLVCVLLLADLSPGAAAGALWRSAVRVFRWMADLREKNRSRRDKAKKLEAYLADKASGLKKGPVIRRPPPEKKRTPQAAPARQETFPFPGGRDYQAPPLDLLDDPPVGSGPVDERILESNSRQLEAKLRDFGVQGEVVEVAPGPVITTYEFMPAPGVKISKVAGLADDLALAMRAVSIRIVAPIPGKAVIGIELPNADRSFVGLKEVLAHPEFKKRRGSLVLALGQDMVGRPFYTQLAKMPHLLIAGATGTGKSVGLNCILMSLLYRAGPDEVKLVLVDPKRIELSVYQNLPHLLHPVVTSPKEANAALKWAVREMERRYELLAECGVRNIDSYNQRMRKQLARAGKKAGAEGDAPAEPLPYIVIVIDELSDMMMVSSKEVEESLTRLAQMARAGGMHLVLATQRPSVDVITGLIKANFPARISFNVSSRVDSRTILDGMGAERLLGAGDMLFLAPGRGGLLRLHGAYVSEEEVGRVVEFIKRQRAPEYDASITQALEVPEGKSAPGVDLDEYYPDAVRLVAESGKASISMIQRRLKVGYNRAARMIERMEDEGLIGPSDGVRPRDVLIGRP